MKKILLLGFVTLWIFSMAIPTFAVLNVGEQAPDFTLTTTTGEEITLSDLSDRIVILHFWKSN